MNVEDRLRDNGVGGGREGTESAKQKVERQTS